MKSVLKALGVAALFMAVSYAFYRWEIDLMAWPEVPAKIFAPFFGMTFTVLADGYMETNR